MWLVEEIGYQHQSRAYTEDSIIGNCSNSKKTFKYVVVYVYQSLFVID